MKEETFPLPDEAIHKLDALNGRLPAGPSSSMRSLMSGRSAGLAALIGVMAAGGVIFGLWRKHR